MKFPEVAPDAQGILSKTKPEEIIALLQDFELTKKLQQIDQDYPYWEKFKYKVNKLGKDEGLLWAFNKILRSKNMSKITICDTSGFSFTYNTTHRILRLLHKFDLNIGGILEGGAIIPEADKNRYLISSLMEEAIASSQLEGAATTREIAKQMLRTNRKPKTIDETMILNNYLTIKRVLEIKNQPISKQLIIELHSIVSKDTLKIKTNEGRLRTNNDVNVVDDISGEIFYIPPDYKLLNKLLDKFCQFANNNDESEFIHPIIKGIILHFLIGYIHPFVDGNGRTARAIFYWFLISKGYWLVEYMAISKIIIKAPSQYAKAYLYSEYDNNDLTYFIDYNLKSMDLALLSLQNYIDRKIMEKKHLYFLIQNENVSERQAELLKGLLRNDITGYTIKEVQTKFGISYQTARTDLMGLQKLGYISERKFSGKKLMFFKQPGFEDKIKAIMN